MRLYTLYTDRFLRGVDDSAVFREYCSDRGIPFPTVGERTERAHRWVAAITGLPDLQRDQIAWEQAAVRELGTCEGGAHLLAAADGAGLPPDEVPDGMPLALWFLLHRPALFREVFFHHDHRAIDACHVARVAPRLHVSDLEGAAASLTEPLRAFFREYEGTGRFCRVDAERVSEAVGFVARCAGRPFSAEAFTDGGEEARANLRSTRLVQFNYYPQEGAVLLRASVRSAQRVQALLDCFARQVLSSPIESATPCYALDRLKLPFHPLPDADDMEQVRLKTLHLRHPERDGRPQIKLDTPMGGEGWAMDELLRAHVREDALEDLQVTHAVLQVRVRIQGRAKNHLVRLWPGRCDVGRELLGDRIIACLRRWGL